MVPVDFLRSLSEQFLPDVCTIQLGTETTSGDGTAVVWSTKQANVPCRVSARGRSASESLGADQSIAAVTEWTIRVPALTDVTARDRIVVGSRTFEVQRVDAKSYETDRACLCTEIT